MPGTRTVSQSRKTRETDVTVTLNLDGQGQWHCDSGVPFLDHMLSHVAAHGMIDLDLAARGDTEIDDHHTVEDGLQHSGFLKESNAAPRCDVTDDGARNLVEARGDTMDKLWRNSAQQYHQIAP